jgi:hypothetical protein
MPSLQKLSLLVEQRKWLVFWCLFAIAFLVRFAILLTVPRDLMISNGEAAQIAHAILTKGQFADPYLKPTGLTAHSNPFFPFFLATIDWIFGETYTGAMVSCSLLIAAYATLYALFPYFASSFGIPRIAGVISGFLGALIPSKRSAEVFRSWEEPFTAILLAAILILFVNPPRRRAWLSWGLLVGFGLYVSVSLAPVVACLALLDLYRSRKIPGAFPLALRQWVTAGVLALAIISPWLIRDRIVLGHWAFMRDNLGLELWLSNHDGAGVSSRALNADPISFAMHPSNSAEECAQIVRLGEWAYHQEKLQLFKHWLAAHPADFAVLTAKHFLYFWIGPLDLPIELAVGLFTSVLGVLGLTLVRKHCRPIVFQAWCAAFLAYPLLYYVVQYLNRYRVPIDWMLWLPTGWVLASIYAKLRGEATPTR